MKARINCTLLCEGCNRPLLWMGPDHLYCAAPTCKFAGKAMAQPTINLQDAGFSFNINTPGLAGIRCQSMDPELSRGYTPTSKGIPNHRVPRENSSHGFSGRQLEPDRHSCSFNRLKPRKECNFDGLMQHVKEDR